MRNVVRLYSLKIISAIALGIASTSAAAQADWLPRPDQVANAEEQPFIADIFGQISPDDPELLVTKVNAALEKSKGPTQFRGLLLFTRALAFNRLDRRQEAMRDVDESIALLPRFVAPLAFGSHLYAFSDRPERSADYLQRALLLSPDAARRISDYDVAGIMRRLRERDQDRRVRRLSAALVESGWQEGDVTAMSSINRAALEHYLEEGKRAEAVALIPKISNPVDSYIMLSQKRYESVWPEIEAWAGPKQNKQWQLYLTNMRDRWRSSDNMNDAVTYARALDAADADEKVVAEFLPVLNRNLDQRLDSDALFLVPQVATSLARLGRGDEALALFDRIQKIWPLDWGANALNISLNRARLLGRIGRYEDSLAAFKESYKAAERYGSEVNDGALSASRLSDACSLYKLGRKDEAISMAIQVNNMPAAELAELFSCMEQPERIRELYLRDLRVEQRRANIISILQPNSNRWPEGSRMAATGEQLRALGSDPEIIKAIEPYGRIMSYAASDGAREVLDK